MAKSKPKPRRFEDCLEALRALGPLPAKKKPKKQTELEKQTEGRLDEVWSHAVLGGIVPRGVVLESLAFVPDDKLSFEALAELATPDAVVASSLWVGVGEWNAGDDEAIWAGKKGEWIVVQAELVRDDRDDGCEVTFAAWRVAGGIALFVTDMDHGYDRVAAVSALALPDLEAWKDAKVWFGE